MTSISAIELHEFEFDACNLGALTGANTIGAIGYRKGAVTRLAKYAVVVETTDGCRGEYVTHWVGAGSALAQSRMLAPKLIGRHAEQRVGIYDDLKRELRQFDHMGHGPLDNALWDLAGKKYNTSVSRLIGGFRKRLPTYASTYHGQNEPGGLDSPEAFADYALACKEAGFKGFKTLFL